ncbi:hypothetical protein H0H92_013342 [Tricholoma furcatifolium]|nr:hypothetical protein H0H92_013342 [Tricholoma furcatifolium]
MLPQSQTLVYKQVPLSSNGTLDIHLDIYAPGPVAALRTSNKIPAIVYFHGGGLTVGNRQSWFPTWLQTRTTDAGYAFVSADYRLLPPSTGHDIVEDIQDVLRFVVSREFEFTLASTSVNTDSPSSTDAAGPSLGATTNFWINPDAIAITGSSAGGLCAYLAAMHCTAPKPKAIVSMYGMGGDFFTPHYLTPKTKPFFRGREILDPSDFMDPRSTMSKFASLEPIADSALAYHPQTYRIPGYPSNPRMLITRLYLQLGVFIDYYTGDHSNEGLSAHLRDTLKLHSEGKDRAEIGLNDTNIDAIRSLVPSAHHGLFPNLILSEGKMDLQWPPTVLIHGTEDSAVPIRDSRSLAKKLEACGAHIQLFEMEGREHSFDYEPGAEELFGEVFDKVGEFLKQHLGSP